jgi:hypothetical protein
VTHQQHLRAARWRAVIEGGKEVPRYRWWRVLQEP